jgi:hypothetical protein
MGLVLLLLLACVAGCTSLPACPNGPAQGQRDCLAWPPSPPPIGPQRP